MLVHIYTIVFPFANSSPLPNWFSNINFLTSTIHVRRKVLNWNEIMTSVLNGSNCICFDLTEWMNECTPLSLTPIPKLRYAVWSKVTVLCLMFYRNISRNWTRGYSIAFYHSKNKKVVCYSCIRRTWILRYWICYCVSNVTDTSVPCVTSGLFLRL